MADDKKHVVIHTDGGCKPNPGPGGYGVTLQYDAVRKEATGGFRLTTNNRMEIFAAIKGLELLQEPCRVTIYSDSQYVVNAMMRGWVTRWKKKNWWRTDTERAVNIDLWERLLVLRERHQVEFIWVRGHAGNPENERCDALSYAAQRQPNLPADEGYESTLGKPGPAGVAKEKVPPRPQMRPACVPANAPDSEPLFTLPSNATQLLLFGEDSDV